MHWFKTPEMVIPMPCLPSTVTCFQEKETIREREREKKQA
jgi:hypothetical protein